MTTNNKKPAHTVKLGSVRAAIWENEGKNGTWFNVTIGRVYKEGEEFKESASFTKDELILVRLASEQAEEWLAKQSA